MQARSPEPCPALALSLGGGLCSGRLVHREAFDSTPPCCQMSWATLRTTFPALSPAQLHRLLTQYQLASAMGPMSAWEPGAQDSPDTFQSGKDTLGRARGKGKVWRPSGTCIPRSESGRAAHWYLPV